MLYEMLLCRDIKWSRTKGKGARAFGRFAFGHADTLTMLGKKFDICGADEPLSYCNAWARIEKEGARRRPLFEPLLNDQFVRDGSGNGDMDYLRQSTTAEIRSRVRQHRFALLFDFASWYDQLALSEAVRRYFGIRLPNGQTAMLKSLPMGFRPSCNVAQSVTWVLVDFLQDKAILQGAAREAVHIDTCIDNVRFTADCPHLLRRVGAEFVRRCRFVGAQLNGYDPALTGVTAYEDLGAKYDHSAKTRALSDKTRRKLNIAAECLTAPSLTRRQLAAVFGICYFAADVVDPRTLAQHYPALHHYRVHVATIDEHDDRAADDAADGDSERHRQLDRATAGVGAHTRR